MEYITNYEALQTTSPPAEMYVRENELTELRQSLEPITTGHHATGAVLYGPSGAGKTHATKYIISQLIASGAGPAGIATTHIDCWDHSSEHGILQRLLAGLGQGRRPSNTPTYTLLEDLRDALDGPYLVVLDEADQIADGGVLKALHQIPAVTLFCIVNEYRPFLRALDMSVESRLEGYRDIEFDAYSEAQLQAILEGRISHGVADGVVPDAIVELLASVSKCDARRAIDNLRKSVHKAKTRGMDAVTPAVVRGVVPETEQELIAKTFSKLTRDQRILYEILVENGGPMSIGEVYDGFRERSPDDNPASRKTAKRELKKMSYYHLVDYGGKNSARRYEAATDELYPDGLA
ncbi:Cdc6/Cdc18 family protein [Natrinema versiforme]|uniref:AAA ATPase n=1 Tax=Natrinema versiforme JCM 10478 TaxID=1227496 RepID=L9Y5B1_9EURY|nr:AAA family ATPase [Natrinema versiforme]ELY68851.1 AAA ATPase [Natrinema versiforme JCM 10478]